MSGGRGPAGNPEAAVWLPTHVLVPLISSTPNGFGREGGCVPGLSCCLWFYLAPSRGFGMNVRAWGAPLLTWPTVSPLPSSSTRAGTDPIVSESRLVHSTWPGEQGCVGQSDLRLGTSALGFPQTGSEPGGLRGPSSGTHSPGQTLPGRSVQSLQDHTHFRLQPYFSPRGYKFRTPLDPLRFNSLE